MDLTLGNVLRMLFYLIVLEQCQDRPRCRLLASTKVFGQDSCPEVSKYLEVAYKCRPTEFRSREVCEAEQLELSCQKGSRLAIYSASFGWSRSSESSTLCAEYSPFTKDCDSPCAYGHVYSRCHGRKRCTVLAQDTTFQSNCALGTPKYLIAVYTCVRKRIMKDIDEGANYPDSCEEDESNTPGNGNQGAYNPYDYGGYDNTDDIESQPSFYPSTPRQHFFYPTTPPYDRGLNPQPGYGEDADPYGDYGDGVWDTEDEVTETPSTGAVQEGISGFFSDWIFTWNFLKDNTEKLIIYITLGLLVGVILVLIVVIVRLQQLRRRGQREAKLVISEPLANSSTVRGQVGGESTSLLEPSDQSEEGGVEMTSYNQMSGSLHRPPVSSFTDPYEEETPVNFMRPGGGVGDDGAHFGSLSHSPASPDGYPGAQANNNHGAPGPYSKPTVTGHHHGGSGGGPGVTGNGPAGIGKPNHTRQTSFSGSLGRTGTQPGTLTGSLNRRDHWTNEYRNEGHSHTLQHYYG